MFTWIIQHNGSILQVFVGEKAPLVAAHWAMDEILSEYTWTSGVRLSAQDLVGEGSWVKVTSRMKEQGLVHAQDIPVLYRMLGCLGKGQFLQAVRALAKLRPGMTVDTSHHARVHTQSLVVSGTGVVDLFGVREVTFTQLDQGLLEREVQLELFKRVQEHDALLFRKEDFQAWKELIDQQAFQEAHLHFKASSVQRVLDVDFEDELQVLLSPRDHLEKHWREVHPALRAAGVGLFTVAHALMHGDTTHLAAAPDELVTRAQDAVRLHQQYLAVHQEQERSTDPETWRPLDQKKGRISLELTVKHLIPELVRLDPNLDRVFFKFTGEHLLEVLPTLAFMPGDNGGWCDLAVKYKNVHLALVDEIPDYPRLDNVALTLTFDAHDEVYQVVVVGTSLSVDTGNSFKALMGQ